MISDIKKYLPKDVLYATIGGSSYIHKTTANSIAEIFKISYDVTNFINTMLKKDKDGLDRIIPFVNSKNFRFNAHATKISDKIGVIVLNAGIMFAINDACSTLVHSPHFLPNELPISNNLTVCLCKECLNVRNFDGWLRDYSWLASFDKFNQPMWNPLASSRVHTPRSVVGGFLMQRCIQWVCFHEIGHLILNHINILGENKYSEILDGSTNIDLSDFHAMEFEADAFASSFNLDLEKTMNNLNNRFKWASEHSTYNGCWLKATEKLTVRLMTIVPYIMGLILSHLNLRESSKHPKPMHRYLMTKLVFYNLMSQRGYSNFLPSNDEAHRDVEVISSSCIQCKTILNTWDSKETYADLDKSSDKIDSFETKHLSYSERFTKHLQTN